MASAIVAPLVRMWIQLTCNGVGGACSFLNSYFDPEAFSSSNGAWLNSIHTYWLYSLCGSSLQRRPLCEQCRAVRTSQLYFFKDEPKEGPKMLGSCYIYSFSFKMLYDMLSRRRLRNEGLHCVRSDSHQLPNSAARP